MGKLYTRKEAAEYLGVSCSTLDVARKAGLIAFTQYVPRGNVFFTETSLREYVARSTHGVKPIKTSSTYRNPRKHNR